MAELEFIMEAPEKGRALAFPSKSFFIGSSAECQVRLQSELLEPKHAEVVCDTRGQWWIRDLVANGLVVVNGRPVLDERLANGDTLRIGNVVLRVHDTGVDLGARTVSGDNIPAVRNDLPAGAVIAGRYRISKRLATGGMGEVYRGEHVELGKHLALKVMLPELSRDDDFVGRFKREAIASSRIGHQNIIDISDFGRTDDGRFYFVMEYVDGQTLKKHLREGGAFNVARVVHVGLQVARALAAAHAVGIIHRDLKPENIMLVQRPGQPDFVKVLDFGIAKVTSTNGTANFTAIGTVVGTPQYMSPEQAGGMPVDARSDVYALGLILHELLTGSPVFAADSAVGLMAAQISRKPPPVTSPHGPVPRPLEHLVSQMLEKRPIERPASMEAVVAALELTAAVPTPVGRQPALDQRTASLLQPLPISGLSPALTTPGIEPVTASFTPAPATVAVPAASSPAATPSPSVPPNLKRVQADPKTELGMELKPVRPAAEPTHPEARPLGAGAAAAPAPAPAPRAPGSTTDAALAAMKPSRLPLLVGAMGLLVVGLAVAIVLVPSRGAKPRPPTLPPPPVVVPTPSPTPVVASPTTPAPAQVKLALETEPSTAEVYEDDLLLGTTPLSLSRPQGSIVTLRFALKGHKELLRKLRFESDSTLRMELDKEKGGRGTSRPPRPGNAATREEELKDSPF